MSKRAGKDGEDQHLRATDRSVQDFLRLSLTYGIEPTPGQVEQIRTFVGELLRWNKKMNLTAARDAAEVLLRHVLDSLVPAAHLAGVRRLLDIGPGGGFPGIPLKVFMPEVFIVLIEARRKKAAFNQHVVDCLGLRAIEVLWARLGDEAVDDRFSADPFDAAISRATFSGTQILELTARVLRPGGQIILMKGAMDEAQQKALKEEVRNQGRKVVRVSPYRLPGSSRAKNLVVIR